jgi:hypothetical protein
MSNNWLPVQARLGHAEETHDHSVQARLGI